MLMKMSEYEFVGGKNGGDEDRVTEWEVGLQSIDDLTPLSQLLILPELALVFSILPEPYKTAVEVYRASQTTFSTLHGVNHSTVKGLLFETTNSDPGPDQDPMVVEADENEITDRDESGSNLKRSRKDNKCCVEIEVEEVDSALHDNENDKSSAATKISNSQTWWISAAMTDHKTCLDGLGRDESRSIALVWRGRESVSDGDRAVHAKNSKPTLK
uniref:Pectinesterase inhibitor domain-containing protein n=1 Tax=Quercus lobata TaxID=97700 RepID=A0A7N2LAL2_QUELO